MKKEDIHIFTSQDSGEPLKLEEPAVNNNGDIISGALVDGSGRRIPIRNYIPRFVEAASYTDSFGKQWNRYRSVQIDKENNFKESAIRFYKYTGWIKDDLRGEHILEAGCGAGRFTQVMLEAGAKVYSFDYSSAVDACWETNGAHRNLCLFQADLYRIPCVPQSFDRIFCYGVLQHTPCPKSAFLSLIPYLKSGGIISIDCYVKAPMFRRWTSKYLWRWLTARIPPEMLFKIIEWYIPRWLPFDNRLAKSNALGKLLIGIVPCWNYTGIYDLTHDQIIEWAVLDTFDALSPKYDKPQTFEKVGEWFQEAGLSDIQITSGSNGIVGAGVKP